MLPAPSPSPSVEKVDPEKSLSSTDADLALPALPQHADAQASVGLDVFKHAAAADWTPEEEKRVLRKIDLHSESSPLTRASVALTRVTVMPLMCLVYLVQFTDKLSISYAALWGMRKDLNIVGAEYGLLTTYFVRLDLLSCVLMLKCDSMSAS